MSSCTACLQSYEISPTEQQFLQKLGFPEPKYCPDCRAQRRVAFRNESKFYKRECDFSKKNIIALFAPDNPNKVYAVEQWFGDDWDGFEYGRDFDFSRSFFPQMHELMLAVPKPSLMQVNNENSPYTTGTGYCKNCHLINSSEYCEDCYYGKLIQNSRNIVDCSYVYDSELLYDCFNVRNCYQCLALSNSQNSTDCAFSDNLNSCTNCFLCTNLTQKKYHFQNQPCSKEEYGQKIAAFQGKSGYQHAWEMLQDLKKGQMVKYANIIASENSTGDFLRNCKNCFDCYDMNDSEDCRYVQVGVKTKNLMDCSNMYIGPELNYQVMGTIGTFNVHFSVYIFHSSDVLYSEHCHNCQHLFGCSGLRNKAYCILNKQYSKGEYTRLLQKIVVHMKQNKEWGEFFPMAMATFPYNDTLAQEYFPLSPEGANARGWHWKAENDKSVIAQTFEIPEDIADVPDTVLSEIFCCTDCSKNYRIIDPELKFYRQMNIALPQECPDCRYQKRMQRHNPRHLWSRNCEKCGAAVQSTYAPDSLQHIYCEGCYLQTVH